jgi:hypothetical protein
MAINRSILSLVTDGLGHATTDFLTLSPAEWADRQMALRYSQSKLPGDEPGDFPYLCWDHLAQEYLAIRTWFDAGGKLNPMLQSASMSNRLSGPIGDGIGWDWKTSGDPDVRMMLFKGPLIAAWRAGSMIPKRDRNSGNMQLGGLATIVRGAYTERAKIHRWSDTASEDGAIKGDLMSRRWVAFRTYTFLMNLCADPKWSWEVSKCKSVFGPIEEE